MSRACLKTPFSSAIPELWLQDFRNFLDIVSTIPRKFLRLSLKVLKFRHEKGFLDML